MVSVNITNVFLLCTMLSAATSTSSEGFDLRPIIDGEVGGRFTGRGRIAPVLSQSIVSIPSSSLGERLNRISSMGHHSLTQRKALCKQITESAKYCPYVAGYNGNVASINYDNRAITPWVLSDDVNADRVPARLTQACCACIHCVNVTGPSPTRMANHYSVPVEAITTVHENINGERRRKSIKIFAGCTCVHKPF